MAEVFGKYELVRRIGVGGMAEVFEARTHGAAGFVKEMVIKRILPVFNEDPDFVRLFIQEARLAARLQHANIVQIFDFNQVDGVHYIAMEWVHGQDLRRIFQAARRRDMPLAGSLAAYVGMEALKGLHYAHTRLDGGTPMGLVHRDISPHNVLISFAGEVKITDFGIAKVAALASTFRSGTVKGKLPYMSPEQVNSRPVDARSDLFSLGIVLWELLTGRRLYTGATEAEVFAQVQRADIPRPTSFASGIPRDLETVVMELLAPDPHRRYQSAQEALADLGQFGSPEDPMETAEYLKKLIPEEAQRERRGETAVQGAEQGAGQGVDGKPPQKEEPPTQAPVAGEAEVPRVLSPPASQPAQTPPEPPLPRAEAAKPGRRSMPRLAAAGAICFLAAGLMSWWVAGTIGEGDASRHAPPPEGAVSSLLVRATPVGSPIFAEGVELASGPARLYGVSGRRVQLRAGEGASASTGQAVFGEAKDMELALVSPKAALEPTRGKASAPDASSPDAAAPDTSARATSTPAAIAATSRKTKRPAQPRRNQARRPSGMLDVFVFPWAKVRVDGREVGQTPIKGLKLAPGRHRVELYNDQGRRERLTVTIKPGKRAAPIKREWEE